jgi:hypothetical protein
VPLLLLLFMIPLTMLADLRSIQAEPNLEKRSELALAHADDLIDEARKAYKDSDEKAFNGAIIEVRESVELSHKSLDETGKAARRNPKYFKRAELKMRSIIRRLDNLEKEVGLEDRPPVQDALKRVHEIHDEILLNIMTQKHK